MIHQVQGTRYDVLLSLIGDESAAAAAIDVPEIKKNICFASPISAPGIVSYKRQTYTSILRVIQGTYT